MSQPARSAWLGAVAVAASIAACAAWLTRMPLDYTCRWGVDAEGAAQFRALLHVPFGAATTSTFRAGFAMALALVWITYVVLVARGLAGAVPPRAHVAKLTAALAVALAVAAPPALSVDVYAYVGYARLAVVHHLNPYVETQAKLVALGDPTGPFLRWPISSPYGAAWTLYSMLVVALLPKASIVAPFIALRLTSAVAVLALAEGGRRLARRLVPGREELVFAALALNPLFLLEGVASGHNDVVMMALVVWALALAVEGRFATSLLLVGLASSIKFVPIVLAPWLVLAAWQAAPVARRASAAALGAGLAAVPVAATSLVFWRGAGTLAGVRARAGQGLHPAGGFVASAAVALVVCAGLTVWVARDPLTRAPRAWIPASLTLLVLFSGMWFPWYFVWPWALALVVLDGASLAWTGVVWGAVLLSQLSYLR
ncbi:MAG TPA: hypothetical protein VHJ20_17190 [Polyangia bacterium]|nr:hypothetical protein [Polyangia bacterium]